MSAVNQALQFASRILSKVTVRFKTSCISHVKRFRMSSSRRTDAGREGEGNAARRSRRGGLCEKNLLRY